MASSINLKSLIPYGPAILLTLLISWLASDEMAAIDKQISDKTWQWIATDSKTEQRVVIVDIDEASIARYGAWPWPRERMAQLSKRIAQQGAGVQIFDMVFATEKAGDALLLEQLKSQTVVLAQILAINADDDTQVGVLGAGTEESLCKTLYPQANAFIANNRRMSDTVDAVGHITPVIDSDGIVRRMPAYICSGKKAYPALALSALAIAINQPAIYALEENQGWLSPEKQLRHQQLPELTIPLNNQGEILLPWWLSKTSLISLSASDLLSDKASTEVLDGAWVLIGSTAFGVGDSVATPQAGSVGGVEVHAQLLSALLDNKLPYQPQGASLILCLWIFLISLLMGFFSQLKGRLLIYGAPLFGVLIAVITLAAQAVALKTQQLWIPSSIAVIYALLIGICLTLHGYAKNWQENQRLYLNLTSYLPEHAAKWIAKQDPISTMEAHHEQVFVMYVDLRNFSNWCNRLPAEQIGAILHTFYKTVTDIVHQHGGQTEKYVGDAVLCVWRNQHNEVLSAAERLVALIEQQFGEQSKQNELPPLAVGVGIEYGTILVGSLGPAQRREYTVIGKAVTTAIQLQEMTTELALPILVGKGAVQKWGALDRLESQGEFLLTGAQQTMEIFTLR